MMIIIDEFKRWNNFIIHSKKISIDNKKNLVYRCKKTSPIFNRGCMVGEKW